MNHEWKGAVRAYSKKKKHKKSNLWLLFIVCCFLILLDLRVFGWQWSVMVLVCVKAWNHHYHLPTNNFPDLSQWRNLTKFHWNGYESWWWMDDLSNQRLFYFISAYVHFNMWRKKWIDKYIKWGSTRIVPLIYNVIILPNRVEWENMLYTPLKTKKMYRRH